MSWKLICCSMSSISPTRAAPRFVRLSEVHRLQGQPSGGAHCLTPLKQPVFDLSHPQGPARADKSPIDRQSGWAGIIVAGHVCQSPSPNHNRIQPQLAHRALRVPRGLVALVTSSTEDFDLHCPRVQTCRWRNLSSTPAHPHTRGPFRIIPDASFRALPPPRPSQNHGLIPDAGCPPTARSRAAPSPGLHPVPSLPASSPRDPD